MRSTHNTIRALAIGIGLTLLVITGTASMMAAFASPAPATDIYRRAVATPAYEPARHLVTAHDTVLYQRVLMPDGRTQWVLIEEPSTSLAAMPRRDDATSSAENTASVYPTQAQTVSYTLVVKPAGLSKTVKNCSRSAYDVYDIACNTVS
jgi:hypothetical protein